MALFETWLKSDLKKPLKVEQLKGNLFSSDNGGNQIGVEVLDNGSPATLTGGVIGYVIRADGATVAVNGSLSGNRASIVLPASAYVVTGQVSIAIKVGSTTVGACSAYVYRTTTDSLVDPGHVIPSIEELLEKIAACEAATTAAMKVANLTVSAEAATGTPTATLTEVGSGDSAHKHITFGLIPGVSPTVTVTTITGGHKVTITDINGDHEYNVMDGTDGVSPTVVVTTITGGHKVVVTDGSGDHEFNVMDGSDGAYVHIRYAAAQPTQDSDMKTTPDAWIGIYTGSSSTAPSAYTSYTWYQFKGPAGSVTNAFADNIQMSSSDTTTIAQKLATKLDTNQGSGNSGKYMKVGADGTLAPAELQMDAKADKVSGATANNFAGLDGNGNLKDSGKSASDFVAANQGIANYGKALGIDNDGSVIPVPFSGDDFTGATSSTAGVHGYVPAPAAGDQDKILMGDGTWSDEIPERLEAVENVCTDTTVTIAVSDWESETDGYSYTWESNLVTSASEVEVFLRDGAEGAGIEEFDYEKVTGGVQFTTSVLPTGNLPVTIRVINAKADAFQSLTGEDIGTDVIPGADNVDEALSALNSKMHTGTIIKSFTNGTASFPFSDLGLSGRPNAIILTPQSKIGYMTYDYAGSSSAITIYGRESDGTSFSGDVRFGYMCWL